jgi:hypothetical protein
MLQFALLGENNFNEADGDKGSEGVEYNNMEASDGDDDDDDDNKEDNVSEYDDEEEDEDDDTYTKEEEEGDESNSGSGMEEENKPFKRKHNEVSLIQQQKCIKIKHAT